MKQSVKSNVIRIEELEKHLTTLATAVQGLQASNKVMQSLSKQTMLNLMNLADEMKEMNRTISNTHYLLKALIEESKLPEDVINQRAAMLQIVDFEEAIAKEDAAEGVVPVELVDDSSVVVITSTTLNKTPEGGFLRSRLDMQQVSPSDFRQNILGKKAGDEFECQIDGDLHKVTLLSVKKRINNEASTDGSALPETTH